MSNFISLACFKWIDNVIFLLKGYEISGEMEVAIHGDLLKIGWKT